MYQMLQNLKDEVQGAVEAAREFPIITSWVPQLS